MTKKQKDAAFIAKLKTLNIGVDTSKKKDLPSCPSCGGPADHPFKVEIEVHPPHFHDHSNN